MQAQVTLKARSLRFVGRVSDLRRWLRAMRGAGRLSDLLARRN